MWLKNPLKSRKTSLINLFPKWFPNGREFVTDVTSDHTAIWRQHEGKGERTTSGKNTYTIKKVFCQYSEY